MSSSTEVISPAMEEVAYWKGRIGETMLVRTASDRMPWEPRHIARVCGRYVFFSPDVTMLDAFSFDVYGLNFKEDDESR